jgi:type IV pilus assembly protein PilM
MGLDIGSSSIKIVQLRRKSNHAILETYGELALGPYAGKAVGEAVNLPLPKVIEAVGDLLKEKEVNITTTDCGVAIPFSSSLMQVIEMPAVSNKMLQTMVPIEARKYIPVPINEVMLDWSVIPSSGLKDDQPKIDENNQKIQPKNEILIVAIHNETLNQYKNIIESCKLTAGFFEIEIWSSMRSILDQETSPILIVDVGASTTKLFIVERGILRLSHMVGRGSQAITNELSKSLGISPTEAEVLKREKGIAGAAGGIGIRDIVSITLDYIFGEANRFLFSYQKKYGKNIPKIILVGGGSALKGIEEIAKKNFQTEVVKGNPFEKIVAPAFLEEVLKETGPEFAVAVGLAMRRLQES